MRLFRLLSLALFSAVSAFSATIAVLPAFNLNAAKSPNLNWIGESIAETIHESVSSASMLVLAREDREEVFRRLAVRPGVVLTKATVIKIGETLDATRVIYGEYSVGTDEYGATSLKSPMKITIHVLDLRKFQESPAFEQSDLLENLSQMEMKLAWMVLNHLSPEGTSSQEEFLRNRAAVRVDAMESYVRGLMTTNPDQKVKLFTQAARIDDHFSEPDFQLGKILFGKKDYKTSAQWLAKVARNDSHYMEAAFLLGLCRYYTNDLDGAIQSFQMVAAEIPLNEVYNNLGAALLRKNDSSAVYNFRKALEGDEGDPDYWFNLGFALWKQSQFAEAAKDFRAVLDRSANDQDATFFLGRCLKMEGPRPGDPRSEGRERIKTTFEDSVFRQLQAELKSKGKV